MAELISLLTFRAETPDTVRTAFTDQLREHLGERGLVASTLPGGRNAGDILVRLSLGTERPEPDFGLGAILGGPIALSDGAIFEAAAADGDVLASTVHRTALFHAFRDPSPDRLARFEQETAAMPRRMDFIRGWSLGRVTRSWGRFAWSHVWEQGYDRLDDLTGRYMRHPCHWGQVDRWFDPEHPEWLIDPGLCHAFCLTTKPEGA
jgi:hypothetical protein